MDWLSRQDLEAASGKAVNEAFKNKKDLEAFKEEVRELVEPFLGSPMTPGVMLSVEQTIQRACGINFDKGLMHYRLIVSVHRESETSEDVHVFFKAAMIN